MRGFPFMLVIVLILAYLAGAKWPGLAAKVGVV